MTGGSNTRLPTERTKAVNCYPDLIVCCLPVAKIQDVMGKKDSLSLLINILSTEKGWGTKDPAK